MMWFKRRACGGTMFHLHGLNNQVILCGPCNDEKIFRLECALESALKTIKAIDERKEANNKSRRSHDKRPTGINPG